MTEDGASQGPVPALETRGVERSLPLGGETVEILRGIDLRILPGEFAALVGPSGSGKSTLLGVIAGLDRPSAGRVLVDGVAGTALGVGISAVVRVLVERVFLISITFHVGAATLATGVVVGLATALIFGLLPIVRAAAIRPQAVLRDLPGGSPPGRRRRPRGSTRCSCCSSRRSAPACSAACSLRWRRSRARSSRSPCSPASSG